MLRVHNKAARISLHNKGTNKAARGYQATSDSMKPLRRASAPLRVCISAPNRLTPRAMERESSALIAEKSEGDALPGTQEDQGEYRKHRVLSVCTR